MVKQIFEGVLREWMEYAFGYYSSLLPAHADCGIPFAVRVGHRRTFGFSLVFFKKRDHEGMGEGVNAHPNTSPISDDLDMEDESMQKFNSKSPEIQNVKAVSANPTTAKITWKTDVPATSEIWYGTSNPLAAESSTPVIGSPELVTDHEVVITELMPGTTYYYMVSSTDAEENTATSKQFSFVTKSK